MIEIKAIARRVFLFPATIPLALQFFSDFPRITRFLPHISLAHTYENGRYRVLYATTELAAYQVHIYADVETEIDEAAQTLYVRPSTNSAPVKSEATLRSLTAPGIYRSRSHFREAGEQCEVEFVMELEANLPRPFGLHLMPGSILNRIADNITNHRMNEITNGFIGQSIDAYSYWEPLKES
jgi:hypothetical protein